MRHTTIAITGSTGFIGTHLVQFLQKKTDIRLKLFNKEKHSLSEPKSLLELLRGTDAVFHLAGETDTTSKTLYETNLMGTINLLKALKLLNMQSKLIFSSSMAIYKIPLKNQVITEHSQVLPVNEYGLSKYLAEEAVRLYSANTGIKSVIVRISNPYGPAKEPLKHSVINTFIRQVQQKKPLTIHGHGNQTRDFIYIEDVVEGLWKAARCKISQPSIVLNIATGKATSLNNVIKLIESCAQKKIKKKYTDSNAQALGYWKIDTDKLEQTLHWKPSVAIEEGVRTTWREGS